MKIAITGHTMGIGKSFSKLLSDRNHEIIGISRTCGNDIKNTNEVSLIIESCDMFINNAHCNFAQTELFYKVWKKWKGQKKYIWNISTSPQRFNSNQDDIETSLYRIQKLSLEEISKQLSLRSVWPMVTLLRPGTVSIKNEQIIKNMEKFYTKEDLKKLLNIELNDNNENKGHTPDEWTKSIIDIFNVNNNIHISEISLNYIEPKDKINI
jgi:hypothetical protein